MKYIGNFENWIKPEWIEYMLANNGTPRPSGGRNPESEEFKQATAAGYDLSQTYWYIYEPDTFPFEVTPPVEIEGKFLWWFIKMLPGNIMPMHQDPHALEEKNSKRLVRTDTFMGKKTTRVLFFFPHVKFCLRPC